MFLRSKKNAQDRIDEEKLYERVSAEMERGEIKKGLWAKALIEAEYDEMKAKRLYIKYRVQNIIDEEELTRKKAMAERIQKEEVPEKEQKEKVKAKQGHAVNTSIFGWFVTLATLTIAVEFWVLTVRDVSSGYGLSMFVLGATLFILWKIKMKFALNKIFFFTILVVFFMLPQMFEAVAMGSIGEFIAMLLTLSASNLLILYLAIRFFRDEHVKKTNIKRATVGILLSLAMLIPVVTLL